MQHWIILLVLTVLVSCNQALAKDSSSRTQDRVKEKASSQPSADVLFAYTSKVGQIINSKLQHHYTGEPKQATVTFNINLDGKLTDLKIASSTKNPELDKIALDTVASCSPMEKPPKGMTRPLPYRMGFLFNSSTRGN